MCRRYICSNAFGVVVVAVGLLGVAVLAGCTNATSSPPAGEQTDAPPSASASPVFVPPAESQFTAVTVTTLNDSTATVHGTDGRFHVVYELELHNSKAAPATLERIEILDANRSERVLASYSGTGLRDRMRTLLPQPVEDLTIAPNEGRFLFVELSFATRSEVPRAVVHRVHVSAADNPAAIEAAPLTYTVARYRIKDKRSLTVEPPLRGDGWVAVNGCCATDGIHRGAMQTVDGGFFDAQRFAIDWIRLDDQGRFVDGDPAKLESYTCFDAPVLSATSGVVVETLDSLPDQAPGTLPDPASLTLETVDGNHVVVDIGHGLYAFYAHLKAGSVRVQPGDRVQPGQEIGRLGNSGNTSAPHLHFHIVAGPSVLGSDGRPYTISTFAMAGQIPAAAFDRADGLSGDWSAYLKPPSQRSREIPLSLDVVDFPD